MPDCANCGHQLSEDARFCLQCGTQAVHGEMGDPLIGRVLSSKYRVGDCLGSGSMGTVYRGEHLGLRKTVALKVLHSDIRLGPDSMQRFQREGIAAGRFNHPNAIQVFDFDRDGNVVYLAMEFMEGVTLGAYLEAEGPPPVGLSIHIVRQITAALAEAHGNGIVHRDLKPDNIMVAGDGETGLTVKVLDFGLSKLVQRAADSSLVTQLGRVVGTPLYMSPEQSIGQEVDHRTDIYSLGLVFYELLTGEAPFRSDNLTELLIKQASAPVPSLRGRSGNKRVVEALDSLLARCLAKRPNDRFATTDELQRELARVAELAPEHTRMAAVGAPRLAPLSGTSDSTPGTRKNRKVLWVAMFAAAGALASLAAVVLLSPNVSQAVPPAVTTPTRPSPRVRSLPSSLLSADQELYLERIDAARVSLEAGEVVAATTSIREAIALECVDAEAYLVRASIDRARGDLEGAGFSIREARRRDPSDPTGALLEGWNLLEREQLARSRVAFEEAKRLGARASAGLGALAFADADYDLAGSLLDSALETDPDNWRALRARGLLRVEQRDGQAALADLEKARSIQPFDATIASALARAHVELEDLDAAEATLRAAVEFPSASTDTHAALASLLIDREEFDEALAILAETLRTASDAGPLQRLRGIALASKGLSAEAARALAAAVDAGHDGADLRLLFGLCLHELGRRREARLEYDRAILLDPNSAQSHLNVGLLHWEEQRYRDAANSLERAIQIDSKLLTAYLVLGVLYMDYLGDREWALDYLSTYEFLGGTDRRVRGWIERLDR